MPPIAGSPWIPPRVPLGERLVRWMLLVIIVASVLVTITAAHVPHRSVATFATAIDRHSVTYIKVTGSGSEQRALWSSGWTSWATTKATDTPSGRPVDLSGLAIDKGLSFWGHGLITRSGSLKIEETLGVATWVPKVAGVVAFLMMLMNGGGWVGNRWAWFWIFASHGLGFTGPILYLLLERQPLWITARMPLPDKPAFGGVSGFFMFIPLTIALLLGDGILTLLFG
jgi:hypothetical protein